MTGEKDHRTWRTAQSKRKIESGWSRDEDHVIVHHHFIHRPANGDLVDSLLLVYILFSFSIVREDAPGVRSTEAQGSGLGWKSPEVDPSKGSVLRLVRDRLRDLSDKSP